MAEETSQTDEVEDLEVGRSILDDSGGPHLVTGPSEREAGGQ